MQSSTPGKRQSAIDYAYDELKRKIIELEYAPSTHLIEENLSRDLEISRTPLRQALYRLEIEGLVVKQPNGRIRVTSITVEEAREVFRVREVLEGLIAREATESLATEHLEELEDILALMRRAAKKERKHDTVKYGAGFHHILHSVSANQTAKRFLEQLNSRIGRYRRISGYKNPAYVPTLAVEEHQKIFDLLKQGNEASVEEAMRSHIKRSLLSIEETLAVYINKNE